MGQRIRTLLIDDSPFMRQVIGDILVSDQDIELIGVAVNGKEGSDMAIQLHPDVVVTDMVMPQYDGMYVVKSVMAQRPVPIILLSSLDKTNSRIFDALQSGAFEFIDKPSDQDLSNLHQYPLLNLVKEASRSDVQVLREHRRPSANQCVHTFSEKLNYEIVVIGASTGGPGAIEYIINHLPANFSLPVIIGQHMPARFLETFAQRLNEKSPVPVRIARKGETLQGGVIYIAPGDCNTRIDRSLINGLPMIGTTQKKYAEFNNPSVNSLFASAAHIYEERCIGVILTGMGRDGVDGMRAIHACGGYTIAQDEDSAVVYGMPKAAVEAGVIRQTVPLKDIPGFIISCL